MNDQPKITVEQAAHLRDLSQQCYAIAEETLTLAAQLFRVYQPTEMHALLENTMAIFFAARRFADLAGIIAEVVETEE